MLLLKISLENKETVLAVLNKFIDYQILKPYVMKSVLYEIERIDYYYSRDIVIPYSDITIRKISFNYLAMKLDDFREMGVITERAYKDFFSYAEHCIKTGKIY